jgi:hypothetical protein
MRIKIADRNRYPLPNTKGQFTHLATIHYGIREFIYFVDRVTQKSYIEEITGGTLRAIDDDNLWNDLAQSLKENGLDIMVSKDGKIR